MKHTIYIYLSGSIQKGKEDKRDSFWTKEDMGVIKDGLKLYNVVFLNPAERSDDLSDFKSTFGRDLFQVYCSDFILVDARDKRGIGIGAEMMFAKMKSIPVISITPPKSHYNRVNFEYLGQKLETWIHPFVFGLSDHVVASTTEAIDSIKLYLDDKNARVLDAEGTMGAMGHYVLTQLHRDSEMKKVIFENEDLYKKALSILTPEEAQQFLSRNR